jgi:segregation and condensation protein B
VSKRNDRAEKAAEKDEIVNDVEIDATETLVEDVREETAPHGDVIGDHVSPEPEQSAAADETTVQGATEVETRADAEDVAQVATDNEPLPTEADEIAGRGSAELKSILEALIFASPDPLTPKAIHRLLSGEPKDEVTKALDELKQDYERPGGLQLVEVAGGYQIVTRPDLHEWVRRLFHERSTQKLSVQALETLAVIAYRQPVTALEIGEIRGVSTSGVINTLLERHLIKIVGRKQVVGRPFMYATTKDFLIRFGLNDLSDLPKVEDMAEALGIESPLLVEQTPAEEQLPLSEPDEEIAAFDEPSSDDGSGSGSIH